MSTMVENMTGSTQVFVLNGRSFALAAKGYPRSTAYLDDEQEQHPVAKMLIEKGTLRKLDMDGANEAESAAIAEKETPKESIPFERAVENVVDVAESNAPDLRILSTDHKTEAEREADNFDSEAVSEENDTDIAEDAENAADGEKTASDDESEVKVQCSGVTAKGTRCKNMVAMTESEAEACGGVAYCKRHEPKE